MSTKSANGDLQIRCESQEQVQAIVSALRLSQPEAGLAEEIAGLEAMLERVANAYGALPQGKKDATRTVGHAVNTWLNYRRAKSEPQEGQG